MNTIVSRTCGVLDKGPQVLAGCCQRPPRLWCYIGLSTGQLAARQQSSPEGAMEVCRPGKACEQEGESLSFTAQSQKGPPSLWLGFLFSEPVTTPSPPCGELQDCARTQTPRVETRIKGGSNQQALRAQRREAAWAAQMLAWSQSTCLPGAACRLDTVSVWAPLGGSSRGLSWQDGSGWQS